MQYVLKYKYVCINYNYVWNNGGEQNVKEYLTLNLTQAKFDTNRWKHYDSYI